MWERISNINININIVSLLHYNVLCLSKSFVYKYSYTLPSGITFIPAAGTELSSNTHQQIYFSILFTRVSKSNFCSLCPGTFLQIHLGYKTCPVKSHHIPHITPTLCNYNHWTSVLIFLHNPVNPPNTTKQDEQNYLLFYYINHSKL